MIANTGNYRICLFNSKHLLLCLPFLIITYWTFSSFLGTKVKAQGPFKWMKQDNFDLIMAKMQKANPENCDTLSESDLRLDATVLSQLPQYNTLPIYVWYQNRTKLIHLHNMALNRGYFYSYISQRLNSTLDAPLYLPMLMYYYFSAAADVSAGPAWVNVSSVLYDTNCSYAGWFTNKDLNTTLPLFAPYAQRLDNWNDELNFLREPDNNTVLINDLGTGPNSNYTAPWYKNNPYISDKEMGINFIPDYRGSSGDKAVYATQMRLADINGYPIEPPEVRSFFGPNAPGVKETHLPVRFTKPYYDCGRTNRWLVSAVSSVTDYMPRYSFIDRLRGPRRVALTLMSLDLLLIDFNPCPPGLGNPDYYLANTARCKPTTMCVPLPGFGFARGGYECVCQPGFRLPIEQVGPFRGIDIEQATADEYQNNFDCIPVGWRQVYPFNNLPFNNRERRDVSSQVDKNKNESILSMPGLMIKKGLSNLHLIDLNARKDFETDEHYFDESAGRLSADHPLTRLEKKNKTQKLLDLQKQDYLELLMGKSREVLTKAMLKPKYDLPELLELSCSESADGTCNIDDYAEANNSKRRVKRDADSGNRIPTWFNSPFYHLNFGDVWDRNKFFQVQKIVDKVQKPYHKCESNSPDDYNFPGEMSYGAERQFEMEGRVALRLAHFLSAYYQNNIKGELFGSYKSGFPLNRYQLFGEVMANVLGSFEIVGSGIFFDNQVFTDSDGLTWDLFAPYAYLPLPTGHIKDGTQAVESLDMSVNQYRNYTEQPWFRFLKERWASNRFGLEKITTKSFIRSGWEGYLEQRHYNYPLYYRAARYEDGFWSNPYFDCYGPRKDWLITYSAPFFGPVGREKQLRFMGVVTVSVLLARLDINQCPQSFYTPNYFKNTARCDFETTYCEHIPGRKFNWGSYKCQCRQGYEYPFESITWFFDGETLEKQYMLKMSGEANRFEILKCRQSVASSISHASVWILSLMYSLVTFAQIFT